MSVFMSIYSVEHAKTFPLSGMPLYIRYPLLTIFPAGLMAWFPTMIILGKTTSFGNFYPAIFALIISFTAAYFFKKGFRYYVKKGSTAMFQADIVHDNIAVETDSVSKTFTQWQRKEGSRNIFKQELHLAFCWGFTFSL